MTEEPPSLEPQFGPWGSVSAEFWADEGPDVRTPPRTGPVPSVPYPAPMARPGPVAPAPSGPALLPPAPAAPAADAPASAGSEPQVGADQPPPPPEEYRERVMAITAAFAPPHDPDRLAWAAVQAEQLDQEATAAYGPGHTHTISIRELRGWLAGLRGDPGAAVHWDLHVIGLQAAAWGTRHAITRASAQRAVRHWMQIPDAAARLAASPLLLGMLADVTGADSELSRHVRSRSERLRGPAGPPA